MARSMEISGCLLLPTLLHLTDNGSENVSQPKLREQSTQTAEYEIKPSQGLRDGLARYSRTPIPGPSM